MTFGGPAIADGGDVVGGRSAVRTYAISEGESLIAKVQGATPQQIDAQCKSPLQLLQGPLASVAVSPRDVVLGQVGQFISTSGQTQAQLGATAKICLLSGYRTDSADVALSSAMILTTLGNSPYAELVGHHLISGSARPSGATWRRPGTNTPSRRLSAVPRPFLLRAIRTGRHC